MGSGASGLEIARSGMLNNERALYVTGHNIANVNTPGFVRQQAMIATAPYQDGDGQYQLGLGCDIQEIRQIRNIFLDNIYRNEVTTQGYWEARDSTFQDIQSILGKPIDLGLQNVISQFWDAWQELSKTPDSLNTRALVTQRGNSLVQQINQIGSQLDALQSDLNSEINDNVNAINGITKQIAGLNLEILQNEISKDNANDFRDQRNVLIDSLSKLMNVNVQEMNDGQVDVTIGGYYLVNRSSNFNLIAQEANPGDIFVVPKLENNNIIVPINSGTLEGLMEARGQVSGAPDSVENGSPKTKADIIFAVDVSDTSAGSLLNIKSSINTYIQQLTNRGIDYNLRLVTFDSAVESNVNYSNDSALFINDINLLSATVDTGDLFSNVVNTVSSITDFRNDASKYMVVFTNESIDGDEVSTSDATVQNYITLLENAGIKTSVVTNPAYFTAGDSPLEPDGWETITNATSGKAYDITSVDFNDLMTTITTDINTDINKEVSLVTDSTNILSDFRKRINAEINTIMREINYLQSSGETLSIPPQAGQAFFVPINPAYPLQMGNIQLNANLNNVINLVSSVAGSQGDNTIALQIADLRNQPILSDTNDVLLDPDDYYQTIISSIGTGGSEAANILDNQNKLVDSAENQRQSIMGVSMDEEMSNMLKYKYAYTASSRAINIIDNMLDVIINRMGKG